jgi:uncharacterized protein YegL
MTSQLEFTTTLEYDIVEPNKTEDLYVMASIKAPLAESEERSTRAPIQIVCVIDKSGSMSGNNMKLVRESLVYMIDQLKSDDKLALITFSDDAQTLVPLTNMDAAGKRRARSLASDIHASGSTNLSGGIFEGLEVFKSQEVLDVNSMILFTDGQANRGITRTEEIIKGMEGYTRKLTKPLSVFTFGFGSHDANLLRAISEAYNGMYYFVEQIDEVPSYFGNCLGGLLTVFAQNIKLSIVPHPDVTIKRVHSHFKTNPKEPNGVELSIGDIYSEEQKDIVFEVSVKPFSDSSRQNLVTLELSFFNVISKEPDSMELVAVVSREISSAPRTANVALDAHRSRIKTANTIMNSITLASTGDLTGSRRMLGQLSDQLSRGPVSEISTALSEDVNELMDNMRDEVTYSSRGLKLGNQMQQMHSMQRSSRPTKQQVAYQTPVSRVHVERAQQQVSQQVQQPAVPQSPSTRIVGGQQRYKPYSPEKSNDTKEH